jgi:hypothetical protein
VGLWGGGSLATPAGAEPGHEEKHHCMSCKVEFERAPHDLTLALFGTAPQRRNPSGI